MSGVDPGAAQELKLPNYPNGKPFRYSALLAVATFLNACGDFKQDTGIGFNPLSYAVDAGISDARKIVYLNQDEAGNCIETQCNADAYDGPYQGRLEYGPNAGSIGDIVVCTWECARFASDEASVDPALQSGQWHIEMIFYAPSGGCFTVDSVIAEEPRACD